MAEEKVIVPTRNEIGTLNYDSGHTRNLIRQAQKADVVDKQLTIKQALKKYKMACFWAVLLSLSLIMEGYDLVIVSAFEKPTGLACQAWRLRHLVRLPLFTVKLNFRIDLEPTIQSPRNISFQHRGNPESPTRPSWDS